MKPELGKTLSDFDRSPHRSTFATVAVVALSVVFVAMRVATAWMLKDKIDGDLAAVQMTVRSRAAALSHDGFTFGLAGVCNLETAVGTFTHLIFARTDFGSALGTALFVILMAIPVVRISRRIGNGWTVAVALALCTVGSVSFMRLSASPRGAFGVFLFATMMLLDIGCTLICDMHDYGICRKRICAALGLMVGMSFWCRLPVIPAVVTMSLLALLFAPTLLLRLSFWIVSITAFVMGAAPRLLWHGCEAIRAAELPIEASAAGADAPRHMLPLVLDSLFDLNAIPTSAVMSVAVVLAASAAAMLGLLIFAPTPHTRKCGLTSHPISDASKIQFLAIFAYLVIFMATMGIRSNAPMHPQGNVLVLVPILAILAGAACTAPRIPAARWIALAASALILARQVQSFRHFRTIAENVTRSTADFRNVVEELKEMYVTAAYCDRSLGSMNLASLGQIVFSDPQHDGPALRKRKLSDADDVAVIDNHCGFVSWARASGGSCMVTNVAGFEIATDFTPPTDETTELDADRWLSLFDGQGNNLLRAMTDRNLATSCHIRRDGDALTLNFKEPQLLCGIRFIADARPFLESCRVSGIPADGDEFTGLGAPLPDCPRCYWSGPRFYPDCKSPMREIAFTPAKLAAIRIEFTPGADSANGSIYEIQVLAPGTGVTSRPSVQERNANLSTLIDILHRQGVRRLYAERWVADRVHKMTGHDIETNGDGGAMSEKGVELDSQTAILATRSGTASARDTFSTIGLKMREIEINGLGTLFLPESNQSAPFGSGVPTGIAFYADCTALSPSDAWIGATIGTLPKPVSPESMVGLFRLNPESVPLLRVMLGLPFTDDALLNLRDSVDRLTIPTLGDETSFGRKVTWHGARLLNADCDFTPGNVIALRHYWSSDTDVAGLEGCRVVVRFTGPDSYVITDEFGVSPSRFLLDPSRKDADSTIWRTDRRIVIPNDAPTGMYEMRVDVYDAVRASSGEMTFSRLRPRNGDAVVNPIFATHSAPSTEFTRKP